jgi:hypothetical protein
MRSSPRRTAASSREFCFSAVAVAAASACRSARAGETVSPFRRLWRLRAPRAHTKAPCKPDLFEHRGKRYGRLSVPRAERRGPDRP